MKRKRKIFKKSEKTIIFLASVLILFFTFYQLSPLYSAEPKSEIVNTNFQVKDKQAESNAEDKGREQSQKEKTSGNRDDTPKQTAKQQPTEQISSEANKDAENKKDEASKEANVEQENKEAVTGEKKLEKIAYLTIDDGPSNVEEEILDLLAKYDAKATFFMLEPNMRKYPDSIKRMVNEGHSVGLHGVTHDAKRIYASKQSVVQEMDKAQSTLEEMTGVHTHLIRTPYGSYPYMTPEYKQAVQQQGYILWDWNIDSRDWKYRDKRYVSHTIEQLNKIEAAGEAPVILLHSKSTTLQYLPQLLNELKSRNYTLKAIDETINPCNF